MRKYCLLCGLLLCSFSTLAQTVRLDNGRFNSLEETVVATMRCKGLDVQFAKGVRWTAPDFSAEITVAGPRGKLTTINPSCHRDMTCVSSDGQPAVLIVTSPACGGNAVADEYTVIDLRSMQKRNLSYEQAKKLR